jgi:hypothetical protein
MSSITLLSMGLFFVYISLKAMNDDTGQHEPFGSILLFPGIGSLLLSSLPLTSFILLKRKHSTYFIWTLTVVGFALAILIANVFFL